MEKRKRREGTGREGKGRGKGAGKGREISFFLSGWSVVLSAGSTAVSTVSEVFFPIEKDPLFELTSYF